MNDALLNTRETNTLSIRVLQNKKKLTYSDIDKVYNETMNKNLKQLQERFNDVR